MIWKKRCFWAVICPMMYILVLLAVVPFVYGIVDDRTMMEVISGQYLGTPDAHGFFTGYWYPLLVAVGLWLLARNHPAFRRYMAFLAVTFFVSEATVFSSSSVVARPFRMAS